MTSITTRRRSTGKQLQNFGLSTVPVLLTLALPKCPLCWAALMSALAVGPTISFHWLRPLSVSLLLVATVAAFLRARQRRTFGPFYVTLGAAVSMYIFKFALNYDVGVYVCGVTLFIASIWNTFPKSSSEPECACEEIGTRS